MPEGPEIRRAADRVADAIVGDALTDVFFAPARLKSHRGRLLGATVTAVDTHGKAMLTRFDNGLTLYSHNQLYGRWYVRPRGSLPETGRSLRVALHTARASALLYSASDIDVLSAAGVERHPFLRKLGPDVLDPALEWRALSARLDEPRFRGRALASLYLDQGFLAGSGNYLRSEVLFFAGVDPRARPCDLGRAARNRLARETLRIARRSYATGGVTNPPARVRRLKSEGRARRDYRFAVFERDGEPCYGCQRPIEKAMAGSRRVYFCPTCQATV